MDETKSRPRPRKTAAKTVARKAAPEKAAPEKRPRKASPTVPVDRDTMVRTDAYFRAERRGFVPGYEIDDWLAAEAEVGDLDKAGSAAKPRKAPLRKPRAG
jgi:hypothetical protein